MVKKKAENDKKNKAKEKVDNLLKDVIPKKKTTTPKKVDVEEKKSTKWLEAELERLTEINEKLEAEAKQAKDDYKKLFESSKNFVKPMNEGEIEKRVRELFREFENA